MTSGARHAFAVVLLGALAVSPRAPAAPPAAKPAPAKPAAGKAAPAAPMAPLTPLAILPSIARVKLTSHGQAVSIVEEVNLPRGEWKGETLRFHVAFGAPGPRAIDAHLVVVGDGELEPEDDEAGDVLTVERVPRRPLNAHPLLGREAMAGIVVVVPADLLKKALAPGNMASLRIRSLVDVTGPDASGASSAVVRLGASRGTPLTLGRVSATAAAPAAPLTRVEARLCGPDADPHPLAVGITPRVSEEREPGAEPRIAPVLSVRRTTDDLCLRWWSTPKAP